LPQIWFAARCRDRFVAATAESNGCIVVTDNERDFAGIEIVNPPRR
jgi:predicted nucleic acid-binding protein